MASWTKATLAARVLESLGVVGEGQAATAEQLNRTNEVIDSVWYNLRQESLVPFLTSSIPEGAQQGLLKVVAAEVAPKFGYSGPRLAERVQLASIGRKQLASWAAGKSPPVPIKVKFY